MDRDAAQVEPRQRRQPAEAFGRAVDADAELVFGLAGRNLRMRARIDVGIDEQNGGRGLVIAVRDFGWRGGIGGADGRGRVCSYGWLVVVDVTLKKTKKKE